MIFADCVECDSLWLSPMWVGTFCSPFWYKVAAISFIGGFLGCTLLWVIPAKFAVAKTTRFLPK